MNLKKRLMPILLAALATCSVMLFGCDNKVDDEKPPAPIITPDDPDTPDNPDAPDDPDNPDTPDEKTYYTVTFDHGDGTTEEERIEAGSAVAEPQTPEYGDNIFLGWFYGGAEYDFSATVDGDVTIKALWEKVYGGNMRVVSGRFDDNGNGYTSGINASMMVNETDGFDRGTIEVTVASPIISDSGIVLCLTGNGNSFYEGEGISYYNFFVSLDGSAYLGKTDNGVWTALKVVPISGFEQGRAYRIKTVLDGTNIYCYVDGKLYIAFSERRFLTGTGYGIRTSAIAVKFTDFEITGKVEN